MKHYRRLLFIAALSLLMVLALVKLGRVEISLNTLKRVHAGWYGLVIVSFYASVAARGWRWRRILHEMGHPVGLVYASALLTAGLFLSAILPARAGDLGRLAMLKQDHDVPIAVGLASIAAERVLDVFALLVLAGVGGWLALSGHLPPEVVQLLTGVTGLMAVGLVGLVAVPGLEQRLVDLPGLGRLPLRVQSLYRRGLDFGLTMVNSIRLLTRRPAALAVIVGQSFFIWLWDGVIIYFILLSLNIVRPFSISLFTAMTGALAAAIPLTPGALGQYDAALISLLALFGLPTADGSLTVLLLRVVQLWTFIPVSGLVTYVFGFSRALSLGEGRDV